MINWQSGASQAQVQEVRGSQRRESGTGGGGEEFMGAGMVGKGILALVDKGSSEGLMGPHELGQEAGGRPLAK